MGIACHGERRSGLALTFAGTFPRRGEVWTVELPGQPADLHTPRPSIVISVNVRNRLAGDVLVVPLTTTLRPLPTHILIPAGAGGQQHDSMAICEQVTCLDKAFLVRGPLGSTIPGPLLDDVVRAIRRATGEVLP